MSTDTPRTDAIECGDYEKPFHFATRVLRFSRTLEVELAAAHLLRATPDSEAVELLREVEPYLSPKVLHRVSDMLSIQERIRAYLGKIR